MKSPSPIPLTNTSASVSLDLLRGFAALMVCLEHWRNLLFVDYSQIARHSALLAIPYGMTGAGHQAVVIFFVLSGYLISGSILRLVQRGQWSWRLYLTHRLVRLWIVLVPALILGAFLDSAGIHLHLAPALYAGQTGTHMLVNVADSLNLSTFAGNLFFLQGILVKTFGSNGPLWSLANEFWYYILFPCAFLVVHRSATTVVRVVSAMTFLAGVWLVGKDILSMFPIWLLGTLLTRVPAPRAGVALRIIVTTLYCPLFFFLAKTRMLTGVLSDYILGVATFILIWVLLAATSSVSTNRFVKITRLTARFSYTLYLVHVPFLVFFTAVIAGESRWQPNARHLLAGAAELSLAIVYAFAVANLTEFQTDHVRRWVEKRLPGKPIPISSS
jgi:peptidoglycan/LPS O-acetylase OafA/YrhL